MSDSIFKELRRRNVFKVATAYMVLAWVIIQVTDTVVPALHLPEWVNTVVVLFGLIGFPFAIFFAWAFELTPEGIKHQSEVDKTESITHHTGRKIEYVIIGLLAVALAYFIAKPQIAGDVENSNLELSSAHSNDKTKNGESETEPHAQSDTSEETTVSELSGKYKTSIAVLPFANMSSNKDTDYFVAGLHDDLLTQLSKISAMKVISRTSVLKYAGSTPNMKEVGKELGVKNLVEGGVQRVGDRIRLNVQLINAETDDHLWAETFDRTLTAENLFDIQSEITLRIANALNQVLNPQEERRINNRPTDNLEAYEALLSSRYLQKDSFGFNLATYEHSQKLLQKAVELDPNFVEAWAALASNLLRKYWQTDKNPEDRAEAKNLLDIAGNLDPENVWVLSAKGYYHYWGELDYAAAIQVFNKVLEIAPNQADLIDGLAYVYRRKGDYYAALNQFNHLIELDPNNEYYVLDKASLLRRYHRFDSALEIMERASQKYLNNLDLDFNHAEIKDSTIGGVKNRMEVMDRMRDDSDHQGEIPLRAWSAYLHGFYGEMDKMHETLNNWPTESISVQGWYSSVNGLRAIAQYVRDPDNVDTEAMQAELRYLEKAKDKNPDSPRIEITSGIIHAILGDSQKALESAKRIREIYPVSKDVMLGSDYFESAIEILVLSENLDLAFLWLEEYLSMPTSKNLIQIKTRALNKNMLADPRLAKLEKKFGLVHPDLSQPTDLN